jgi:predicted ester cyclase
VKKFVREFRTAFPDITHTIEDQNAEVDKVSARFTMHGTHKDEYWGSLFAIRETARGLRV